MSVREARDVIANKHLSDGGESLDDCYPLHRVAAYEIADKYLTALRSAGWAVVPVEPTEGMLFKLWKGAKYEHGGFIGVGVLRTIYASLIQAAQEDSRE